VYFCGSKLKRQEGNDPPKNAVGGFKYRSDRTPTLLTIVTSSSYLGDYFTGGSGSVAYFDEFRLIYY
jgi:hypothetical protein